MPRKWLPSEFPSDKPIRAVRNGPVQHPAGRAELMAALERARNVLESNAPPKAVQDALAELRGCVNFYRNHYRLDAIAMGVITNATHLALETKYLGEKRAAKRSEQRANRPSLQFSARMVHPDDADNYF